MAISAACIRTGSLRLCLAMILGLLVVSGYVVTPILFAKAESAMQAGMFAGHIFHMVNMGVLFLAAAVASFWMRSHTAGRLNWVLLLLIVVLVSINEFGITPHIQALKDTAGDMHALAKDDPQRVQFGIYHGASAVCHLLASLMATLLVALGGSACKDDTDNE